jgi:hypothetical protein
MEKPTYVPPAVEVVTAEELLEAIGMVQCASGSGGPNA